MSGDRLWVALEGPCCAGKTTLGRRLTGVLRREGAVLVPCYADHVGGGRYLPAPVPGSLAEDQRALRELLAVEVGRTASARLDPAATVVVLDRSVHTLLAHRHAVERMTGLPLSGSADRILTGADGAVWPDLVLYLDVPQEAVRDRNAGKFPDDSLFIDSAFNASFRSYFLRLARRPEPRVAWLDATREPRELVEAAHAHIRSARHRDTA